MARVPIPITSIVMTMGTEALLIETTRQIYGSAQMLNTLHNADRPPTFFIQNWQNHLPRRCFEATVVVELRTIRYL